MTYHETKDSKDIFKMIQEGINYYEVSPYVDAKAVYESVKTTLGISPRLFKKLDISTIIEDVYDRYRPKTHVKDQNKISKRMMRSIHKVLKDIADDQE